MAVFTVACVQTNSGPDVAPNLATVAELVRRARDAGAEGRGDEHLVGALRMAPGDVAAEGFVAVARGEAPGEVELDILGRLGFELRARPRQQDGEEGKELHPRRFYLFRRLIVFCSVSLSGLALSDSCQTRFASSRSPMTQSVRKAYGWLYDAPWAPEPIAQVTGTA